MRGGVYIHACSRYAMTTYLQDNDMYMHICFAYGICVSRNAEEVLLTNAGVVE